MTVHQRKNEYVPESEVRLFFWQAIEIAIWFTEVASGTRDGKKYIEDLNAANLHSNPGLMRLPAEAGDRLNSGTARAFPKPPSARIVGRVISHLSDEVMKVFRTK